MFMAWFFDNDIFDSISNGGIAYELCRPCNLYNMWFVKNMAIRLSRTVLRCAPILLVAAFLPSPYSVTLPAGWIAGLLFILSLLLGFLVLVAFSMLIYLSAFYTISSLGIRLLATSVVEFFAGGIIPLPFLPESIQPFFYALPFASMQNTPFLIYTGYMQGDQALWSMAGQCAWLAGLVLAGRLLMHRALKKVVVQGG